MRHCECVREEDVKEMVILVKEKDTSSVRWYRPEGNLDQRSGERGRRVVQEKQREVSAII